MPIALLPGNCASGPSGHENREGDDEVEDIFRYVEDHASEYTEMLYSACRQPSISAQNVGMREMATLVRDLLLKTGAVTEILETSGNPFVYGFLDAGRKKTLSCYNHYDVQPVDPIEEWESDPFVPELRDGRIYARGVADNKGNLLARICAVHAWLQVRGTLPVNMKFICEGEEEVGSPHLKEFPVKYPEKMKTDGILWEGGSRNIGGPVHVALGAKGMCYVEMKIRTAVSDLHSANAAVIPNPAWILVRALNSLKDAEENILIEGFYDGVKPLTDLDREYLEKLPYDEKTTLEQFGTKDFLLGLSGYPLRKRLLYSPTCNIAGMISGYTGPGGKTVLPAVASAKMDIRLVPDQDPDRIFGLLRAHLDRNGFGEIELSRGSSKPPFRTDPSHPLASSVIRCVREVYGAEPAVYLNLSGTSPIYDLCSAARIGAVQVGVANEDSRAHAPNENIFLRDYIDGIKLVAAVMEDFSRV